jgi:protein-tyrosine phosphatase
MIDIHSHILPNIDDGARSLEESLQMAEVAAADGIEQMVATPHLFNGLSYDPEPAEIVDHVAALQSAIGAKLKILPGSEAHVIHDIADRAKSQQVTTINRCNYLLVEFPQMTVPVGADDVFNRLQLQGIHPILVHPERNHQLQKQPSLVAEYASRGVYIQVTAMSMAGEFGTAAKKCGDLLLQHNCVHFLASDTHRPSRRPPILSRGRDAAAKLVGQERARRLVYDNPLAVVEGRALSVEPPIPFETRGGWFFSRLFK